MFQLIITILSIALVVALISITTLYSGKAMTEGEARRIATRLKTEEQQVIGAMEIYKAQRGEWPATLTDLVENQYLQRIPDGYAVQQAPGIELIRSAYAQHDGGWAMPATGRPLIVTSSRIPTEVCRMYNLISRGDDGILKQALTSLGAQCFGQKDSFRIVVMQAGAGQYLSGALAPSPVADGGLPSKDAGDAWWEVNPQNEPVHPVDPSKTDQAELVLEPSTHITFGLVQIGQTQVSSSRLVRNVGPVAANPLTVTVPSGFSLAANSCALGVIAGGSCSFALQFSPVEARAFTGTVSVAASNTKSLTFSVEGEGSEARASLSAVDFKGQPAGSLSTMESTLRNEGLGPLTLGNPTVQGVGFVMAGNTCGSTLGPGNSCTLSVGYYARGMDVASGTLSIPIQNSGEVRAPLSGHSLQPALRLSVSSRDFGDRQVGQKVTGPAVVVTNTGNAAAQALDISVPEGFTLDSTTCSSVLNPGAGCSIRVGFSPMEAKHYSSYVEISAGDVRSSVMVTGNGVASAGSLSEVIFGAKEAGTVSELSSILYNTGIGPLEINMPGEASVSGSGFSFVRTTCGASLTANDSCSVTVAYAADGTADATGTLSVRTSAGDLTARLSGSSQAVVFDVSSVHYDFSTVQANQIATAPAITLKNNGNFAAANMTIRMPDGYRLASTSCTSTLQPGAECTMVISFEPTEAKHYSGLVQISADRSNASIVLGGHALAPSATLSDISFGAQDEGTVNQLSGTLVNTGVGPLNLTVPSPSSVSGAGFWIRETSCRPVLAAKESCTVTVAYSATGAAEATGTLSVATSAGLITAKLSGEIRRAKLTFAVNSYDFKAVQVGSQVVSNRIKLTNTGTATAENLKIEFPSWVKLQQPWTTCATSLEPGNSCDISLDFYPTQVTEYNGTLKVTSGETSVSASLVGAGRAASGTLSAVDFGAMKVGETATRTVTLTNTGVGYLTFVSSPPNALVTGVGFSFESTTCPRSLQYGSSNVCTVTVRYTASSRSAQSGTVSANFVETQLTAPLTVTVIK